MKLDVNMNQVKKLERILRDTRERAVKYAQRNALNDMAFETRRGAVAGIKKNFVNRNQFTQRSVRVNKALSLGSGAEVGSTQDYMRKQELGGPGKMFVASTGASGESPKARVRRRSVRGPNKINAIGTANELGGAFGSRQERNMATLKDAKKRGKKVVKMRKGPGRVGIYKVMGTVRRPKARLLYNVRTQRVVVKRRAWLGPVARDVQNRQGPSLYFAQMRKELRRLGAK